MPQFCSFFQVEAAPVFTFFTPVFLSHSCSTRLHANFVLNKNIFFLSAFKASLYFCVYFQGEERQQKQNEANKKKKQHICFTGSEAETHDVISDARVHLYLDTGMNVRLCRRVEEG